MLSQRYAKETQSVLRNLRLAGSGMGATTAPRRLEPLARQLPLLLHRQSHSCSRIARLTYGLYEGSNSLPASNLAEDSSRSGGAKVLRNVKADCVGPSSRSSRTRDSASEIVGSCPSRIHHSAVVASATRSNHFPRCNSTDRCIEPWTQAESCSMVSHTLILTITPALSARSHSKALIDVEFPSSACRRQTNPDAPSAEALTGASEATKSASSSESSGARRRATFTCAM